MGEQAEQLRFRRKIDQAGWTQVYHVLTLDKELSDGAFRLYVLVLKYARQSDSCWPGVKRLADDLGKTESTIKRRLAELSSRGLITRERRFCRSSITWIEDLEQVYERLKNEPNVELKNEPTVQLKNEPTEEKAEKNNQRGDDGGPPPEQNTIITLLTNFGVSETVARRLARQCDSEQVEGWLAYARNSHNLRDPVGLVVRRLLDGEPAPSPDRDTDRRRYISGEYADLIQR